MTKTWVVVVSAAGILAIGFGGGLLTGRQFPAKHYERFGGSMYLYDVSTGKICNPFPPPPNLFDQLVNGQNAPPQSGETRKSGTVPAGVIDLSDIWGQKAAATPQSPLGPPPCGK